MAKGVAPLMDALVREPEDHIRGRAADGHFTLTPPAHSTRVIVAKGVAPLMDAAPQPYT